MKLKKGLLGNLKKNRALFIMLLPGALWLFIFCYIPMFGVVIAFKDFRISSRGFFTSLFNSPWVGWENFKYLFASQDAWIITRNTVVYNVVGILLSTFFTVSLAIILSQMANKRLLKKMQTFMIFPNFLSWVVISYFVYAFLSTDKGLINILLSNFGVEPINWYSEPKYWPFIIVFTSLWKGVGYGSIIYYASIMGIDTSYYEAALVDGASKWQQIRNVVLPHLRSIIVIMLILSVGSIFRADFGLFYQLPRNSGALYDVTNVLDTYVYRGLMNSGDIGMSTAAGLYQSSVGFVLILITNKIVNKLDPSSALF
ncbi:sugar ABC transporter permease (plasmid) [Enterococcus faecium]|uniref:ABC transporter permease n=1 Tax=Enterococcus faecium TaxID=1352 RepID=UPI0021F9DE09|nr:sugar ABC transporter permease [Enterococcus faecium]BDP92817.1 sugar ABC transporter permease [Enterococcus faecium]